jgi:hypothetical protein
MFTKLPFRTKLDKAIALSLAAMLGFNVLVLSQQLHGAPDFALRGEASARQQA